MVLQRGPSVPAVAVAAALCGCVCALLASCGADTGVKGLAPASIDAGADAAPEVVDDSISEVLTDSAVLDAIVDVAGNDVADGDSGDLCADGNCSAPSCGDGLCAASSGETSATCPADCHACGDGVCTPGEGPINCPADCCGGCGDGKCTGYGCGENPKSCAQDCTTPCGNGKCENGENPGSCSEDCQKQVCGNHVCEPADGGATICPQDCGVSCGNCVCEKGEDFVGCPNDCGFCGDGTCSVCSGLGEGAQSCPADCGDIQQIGCTAAWQLFCLDEEPCTADACIDGKGCVHLPAAATCSDDNACTSGDLCQGGTCQSGMALACADANPCTQDGCDPALGCTQTDAKGVPCDDGDACTQGDACAAGLCAGGKAIGCDDGQACTSDACAAGNCVHLPSAATCNDGDLCTQLDACVGGQCAGSAKLDCNDANPCTKDSCVAASGCKHEGSAGGACSDSDPCSVGDTCMAGLCAPGKAMNCSDGSVCTDDACLGGACVHLPNAATCTDGNVCTTGEHCKAGACGGAQSLGCDDGNACTKDACTLTTGCASTVLAGNVACSDGNACTVGDVCQGGACKPGALPSCQDGNACTDDACAGGACVHLANAAACTDSNACTAGETCALGLCSGATSVDCDDGSVCTLDTCGSSSGLCQHLALDVVCEDGDACTQGDVCKGGLCVGVAVDCADGNSCTSDACDAATGTCPHQVTSCDDGIACSLDACVPGLGCQHHLGAAQDGYFKSDHEIPGAQFGNAVAISGDTMVVGAPSESGCGAGVDPAAKPDNCYASGAAYVFVRSGGVWTQQAYLKAAKPDPGDSFGTSVAMSGDTIVVGAMDEGSKSAGVNGDATDNSMNVVGAAYVFVRQGGKWTQQAYLKASNPSNDIAFGGTVAIAGDTVVVGAPWESGSSAGVNGDQADLSTYSAGAAYIFVRAAGIWSQQAYLKASNPASEANFGTAVAIAGDRVIVGAPQETGSSSGVDGTQSNTYNNDFWGSGAAYVFLRQGTTWSQEAYLKASNNRAGTSASFGSSVAASGDTIAVGAPNEASSATRVNGQQFEALAPGAGAVYVFAHPGGAWQQEAYVKASNAESSDQFGKSVALSGTTLVVGAPTESSQGSGVGADPADNSMAYSGATYVFHRQAGGWSQRNYLKAQATQEYDGFGGSVAASGEWVCVGVPGEDGGGKGVHAAFGLPPLADSGAAYVFTVHADACEDGDACNVDGCDAQAGCVQQANASTCDDSNICTDDSCSTTSGCVFLANVATCTDDDPCTMADGCEAGICKGTPDPCPDGDGCTTDTCAGGVGCQHSAVDCDDSTFCTADTCEGPTDAAYACLHAALTDGTGCTDGSACTSADACLGGSCVGQILACADANACTADLCNTSTGCVFPTTAAQTGYIKASNPRPSNEFGAATALSGDTMVVGAPLEYSCAKGVNAAQVQTPAAPCYAAGAAYVFVREAGAWHQQAYLKASNSEGGDSFGTAVAIHGDTIVIGASAETSKAGGVDGDQADNSIPSAGAAYVFVRKGGIWTQQAYLKASKPAGGAAFAGAVAVSGDTIAVGAMGESSSAKGIDGDANDAGAPASGAVYIFERQAGAWSQKAYVKASNPEANDYFGAAVALAGDILVVGAWGEASGATTVGGDETSNAKLNSGAAYVFVRDAGAWSQEAYLKASNADANDRFGWAVAVSGATVAVGAHNEASMAPGNPADNSAQWGAAGAAYVFVRDNKAWFQQAYIKAAKPDSEDRFGIAVALSGDTLVVGANGESSSAKGVGGNQSDNGNAASGAAYVFARRDSTWSPFAYLKAANADMVDYFGSAVAVSGTAVLVGAMYEDGASPGALADASSNGAQDAGAVYVYGLGPSCDDANPCTLDACNPGGGCQFLPQSGPCEDGNPCTVAETCVGTTCHGADKNCDDANACTADTCAAGACGHAAFSAPCSDGNACTDVDTCADGTCSGSGAPDCNDANPCTADSCDPASGCVHPPTPNGSLCDDGDACSTDACWAGACSHGPQPLCTCAVEFDGGGFAIFDNNSDGTTGSIDLPDLGVLGSGGLVVHVALSNSDTASVRVILIAPDASEVVLYDKKKAGTSLNLTWPPSSVASGSLTAWSGANPKGTWMLKVVDSGYLNDANDGGVSAWRIVPMYHCP